MIKHHLRRLLLATTFIAAPFAIAAAGFGVDAGSYRTANGRAAAPPTATAAAVAQVTETPVPYPSPGGETTPTPTVELTERTPIPEGGYPAGANIDGTGRAGGEDGIILGNEPDNDGAAEATGAAQVGPQIGQSALGSFILWLGFIFGLVVFIGGLFFSIFLSTRKRRSDL